MLSDEIDAVESMFCLPGECAFIDNEVHLNLKVNADDESTMFSVKIVINIPSEYPDVCPQISLFSDHLTRDKILKLKEDTTLLCSNMIGLPMIICIVTYLQEQLETIAKEVDERTRSNIEIEKCSQNTLTCVLHIDHMRSRNKYCKKLEKWCSELDLGGRVIFSGKLILVILLGMKENINGFIVRLKTVSVDVDSRGHPCKEKMMSVLGESPLPEAAENKIKDFHILELKSFTDVKEFFLHSGLAVIFDKFVSGLCS